MAIQGDGIWDEITWPYPQVRIAGNYLIGLSVDEDDELKVYELLNENDQWTATYVASLGNYENIDFVDVEGWGPFYVVTASKIINNILTTTAFGRYPNGTITEFPNAAIPEFATICSFNGQPIIGCIQSDTSPWSSLLYSSVAWAGIGSGFDFRPTEAGNETAGFIHLPAPGEGTGLTKRVMQLSKAVIAYQEDTVNLLLPHAVGRSGFGRKDLEISGIRSGYHVAGGERSHLYLNTKNELVLIGEDYNPQLLGYKEFMEDLDNEEVIITYVPQRKRYYISDSSRGFVLTEQGLYECHQCVTSALYYRGRILCGFFYDTEDWEPRVTLDTLDFRMRGLKTLQSMELDVRYADGCDEIFISTLYRYSYQTSKNKFEEGCWVRLSPEGIGHLVVSATEFRPRFKGVDYRGSDLRISRIDIRYQTHDKRNIRGISNARQNVAGSGF